MTRTYYTQVTLGEGGIPSPPPNEEGYVAFAFDGNSLTCCPTTTIWIYLKSFPQYDDAGIRPFGKVMTGLEVVKSLYSGYGENLDFNKTVTEGNEYLKGYPLLDYIVSTKVCYTIEECGQQTHGLMSYRNSANC
jgi:hypothetical protein